MVSRISFILSFRKRENPFFNLDIVFSRLISLPLSLSLSQTLMGEKNADIYSNEKIERKWGFWMKDLKPHDLVIISPWLLYI